MGGTTADDLLEQANLAIYRTVHGVEGTRALGRVKYDALVRSWPTLAEAQDRVLGVVSESHPDPSRLDVPRGALSELMEAPRHGKAKPGEVDSDPQLLRAAQLTNAAADALLLGRDSGRWSSAGTSDLVLTGMETAARLTAVSAETSRMSPGRWLSLAETARAGITTHHLDRHSELGSTPITTHDEQGLAAALYRWERAATDALDQRAGPNAQLPGIAVALSVLHYAGDGDQARGGDAWRYAAGSWNGVRVPEPDHTRLRAASAGLRAELVAALGANASDPVSRDAGRLTVQRFLVRDHDRLAGAFHEQVTAYLRSDRGAIAAKRLVAETPRPIPTDLSTAAHAGKWVRLPFGSRTAQHIEAATANAVNVGAQAIEARAAQMTSGRMSALSTREMLSRGPSPIPVADARLSKPSEHTLTRNR